MKTVESTPIKIVLAAVSIATIGIIGLAITAPAKQAPQQFDDMFECRLPLKRDFAEPPPPPQPPAPPAEQPLAVTST